MKKELHIWLPPRGDHRLLRFQEQLWRTTKIDAFAAIEPVLVHRNNEPVGPCQTISTGTWEIGPDGLFLDAPNSAGLPLRFWMAIEKNPPWKQADLSDLPLPENLTWTKGRVGTLEFETVNDSFDFVTYSISNVEVWRPGRSKS